MLFLIMFYLPRSNAAYAVRPYTQCHAEKCESRSPIVPIRQLLPSKQDRVLRNTMTTLVIVGSCAAVVMRLSELEALVAMRHLTEAVRAKVQAL
jgi:hypothetical protein